MAERPIDPSARARGSFEAFVLTVTGSSARARQASRSVRERAALWRREGRWPERDERALLFRALGERPALIDVDPDVAGPARVRLPRRLASLPLAERLPWALRECAGWTPSAIAWLLERPHRDVLDALAAAEVALTRRIASDVLVVGREPLVLHGLARHLTEVGHTVVGTAATRTRAIVLARRSPPALVVADVEDPYLGGENEALQALGARLDVPFVLLVSASARVTPEEAPAVYHALVKPYDPDELSRLCLRALLFERAPARNVALRSADPATG